MTPRSATLIPSLGDACLDTSRMDEWTVQEAAWFSYWWLNDDRSSRDVPRPSSRGSLLQQTCRDAACVKPSHLQLVEPGSN